MLYIITGPSGAGKTAVGEYLKQKGFLELISHTTRAPRPGEIHGVAYHFVSEQEFEETRKVEESRYAGNRYGVSVKEVAEKVPMGAVFAVTDLRGAASFKRIYGTGVRVLYIDSSPRFFRARMRERGDSSQSIRRRIRTYRREKEKRMRLFADHVIRNDGSLRRLFQEVDRCLRIHRPAKSCRRRRVPETRNG